MATKDAICRAGKGAGGGRSTLIWAALSAALASSFLGRQRQRSAVEEPAPVPVAGRAGLPPGHDAEAPGQIPARGWWQILKRTYREINDDRLSIIAAGVTFYVLLALFPALGAMVSIYGLFADRGTIGEQLNALAGVLPPEALTVIGDQMNRLATADESTLGFGFALGLALSLWSANQAMKAIFDALNVVYEEEEKRSFLKLNAMTLAFTLAGILLVLVAMALVVVLPVALDFIGLGAFAEWALTVLRWPVLLLVLGTVIAAIYRFGPSRERARWRWVSWGSAFATVFWLIASGLFSWYVANFGNYNETYGSLGAVIGLITWIWISTYIVLIGAELNAEIEHQTVQDSTTGMDSPLGTRGAKMADEVAEAA